MDYLDNMNEEELIEYMHSQQNSYEEWNDTMCNMRMAESDMEIYNLQIDNSIYNMREMCQGDDRLLSILDEKQKILDIIKRDNIEFQELLENEYRNMSQEHERNMQELYQRIQYLQNEG